VIEAAALHDLIARWWWSYDEGHFDFLASRLTDDAHFVCRTDTGNAEWEEFVRADVRGRDAFIEWQSRHRLESPYPLRHYATNVHLVDCRPDGATFACYIHVTHITAGQVAPLPGGVVRGAVRTVDGELRICELEVVLDTVDSGVFKDMRELTR
jgi:hypothetical protein